MKKLFLFAVSLLAAILSAAEGKPPAPESPLAPLAFLVDGVWVGDVPVPKDQLPLKLEARFAWTENRQGVRFESAFVRGEKRSPYTSGLYAWDGAKAKLVIFYVNNDGDLTEGVITQDNGTLLNDLTVTESGGKTYPVRVRLTKIGEGVFTNEIFLQKDGAWAPFVTVRYERRK
jgi:hypothetical protein